MSQTEDKTFFPRVEAHIEAANSFVTTVPPQRVATSMAFAAARFNAFICFANATTREEMMQRRDEAFRMFADEYRRMFEENYNEYLSNFDDYRTRQKG